MGREKRKKAGQRGHYLSMRRQSTSGQVPHKLSISRRGGDHNHGDRGDDRRGSSRAEGRIPGIAQARADRGSEPPSEGECGEGDECADGSPCGGGTEGTRCTGRQVMSLSFLLVRQHATGGLSLPPPRNRRTQPVRPRRCRCHPPATQGSPWSWGQVS